MILPEEPERLIVQLVRLCALDRGLYFDGISDATIEKQFTESEITVGEVVENLTQAKEQAKIVSP